MDEGHCECGERCSCPPGSEARARCNCWHEGDTGPEKVYGLMVLEKSQKPLIEKHCFGDCGKISMAGAIHDDMLGGLMVCCEEACPWLLKQMDKAGEPYGTTMSFGRPHAVYLRTLTDTPAPGVAPSQAPSISTEVSVPREPDDALLRPFYECPPEELRLAWNAMLYIAERRERATPVMGMEATSLTDDRAEKLIEESGGYWKEDVFCIGGPELMALLRAAAGVDLPDGAKHG